MSLSLNRRLYLVQFPNRLSTLMQKVSLILMSNKTQLNKNLYLSKNVKFKNKLSLLNQQNLQLIVVKIAVKLISTKMKNQEMNMINFYNSVKLKSLWMKYQKTKKKKIFYNLLKRNKLNLKMLMRMSLLVWSHLKTHNKVSYNQSKMKRQLWRIV